MPRSQPDGDRGHRQAADAKRVVENQPRPAEQIGSARLGEIREPEEEHQRGGDPRRGSVPTDVW